MTRGRDEIERAIDATAEHAWEGHAWQGMYVKLGIESAAALREHFTSTVWDERTECFMASINREICYDASTNTRVILNYSGAGTCLVTRAGAKEFHKQYRDEGERHRRSGQHEGTMPQIVPGGILALHPGSGPHSTGELTPRINGDFAK